MCVCLIDVRGRTEEEGGREGWNTSHTHTRTYTDIHTYTHTDTHTVDPITVQHPPPTSLTLPNAPPSPSILRSRPNTINPRPSNIKHLTSLSLHHQSRVFLAHHPPTARHRKHPHPHPPPATVSPTTTSPQPQSCHALPPRHHGDDHPPRPTMTTATGAAQRAEMTMEGMAD